MLLSIIIPTYNEAENIGNLIPGLIESTNHPIEIIISDSRQSNDFLEKKLNEYPIIKYFKCEKHSRAAQMNFGSSRASGEILLFLHADVRLPENFYSEIISSIRNGNKMGFFSYRFDSRKWLLKCNGFFTKRNGIFSGGGDQCHFFETSTFKKLNGYDEDYCIMEDFEMMNRIRKNNIPFSLIDSPALVSARKYEQNSWLKVNLINLWVFILFKFGYTPEKLRKNYNSLLRH